VRVHARRHVAVLYNSGIGTLTWPIVEPWLPTAALLLALDVPLLLTCFHSGESHGEQQMLHGIFGARVLTPPADNPLAHGVPVDCLARRDDAAEDALAQEMVEFATVAAKALAAKNERDAAAVAAAQAAAETTAGAGARAASTLYAQLNDVCGIETANARFCWLRGSELRGRQLERRAVRAARRHLRDLCACFGVARLGTWLAGVKNAWRRDGERNGERGGGGERARVESRAMDALMLSEAFKSGAIATRALEMGAQSVLEEALSDAVGMGYERAPSHAAALAAAAADDDDDDDDDDESAEQSAEADGAERGSRGAYGASYTGVAAPTRLGAACEAALARLAAAAHANAALQRVPHAAVTALPAAVNWRVSFGGAYVHVRTQPMVAAPSCGQLARDATFAVDAVRGDWLRVAQGEGHAGGWVLTVHPVHGTLVTPLRSNLTPHLESPDVA
jgi:hypothetical protein